LAEIPVNLIHEPWKLNMIEQQFYDCEIGKDYPAPIVNIEETRRYASDIVWVSVKDEVKEEGRRIEKHVSNPNRKTRKTKF
jgi:deoxyribodipyrimidine photo-lyase